MAYQSVHGLTWFLWVFLGVGVTSVATAQQAAPSDAELIRQGPQALAAAHGETPRYGGKFLSAGNEVIPHYDMHQTSFAGIYTATAPVYNCLVRTSPYDPHALEVVPELAHSWEVNDGGKTLIFHLHKGVKWHDGVLFSSADVKYTIERILNPPQGMISVRGPVFKALIERVEAPDPDTVVVYGKGPSSMLLSLFANGWNMIIPKHIVEKDPVNALKTQVIGTGPFRLKEPPTTTLWKYERNPDYFIKGLPYLDEIEMHLITDPQALAAAILSKRVFWNDAFPHPNLDGDLAQSMSWLRVFTSANTAHLGQRGGPEREPGVMPSEKNAARRGRVEDGRCMITACCARAPQRRTSTTYTHFLLMFQEVRPISNTRNQFNGTVYSDPLCCSAM
jgi:peptide/nickel transport system substrate-binding protein